MRDDFVAEVYHSLRALAEQRLATERAGHTLQATALVHDVYLKLAAGSPQRWADSAHFYHAAAEAMRRVLIDHARAKNTDKRGGRRAKIPLTQLSDVAALADGADADDVLALDTAVRQLEAERPEVGAVVRLRFYAGLSVEQAADALSISPATLKRHWTFARAWLYRKLRHDF